MTPFLRHFLKHVTPRLTNLCKAEAYCIAHGAETFHNAHRIVMDYARRYGALHLPPGALDDLDEWICLTLANEIDACEAEICA